MAQKDINDILLEEIRENRYKINEVGKDVHQLRIMFTSHRAKLLGGAAAVSGLVALVARFV